MRVAAEETGNGPTPHLIQATAALERARSSRLSPPTHHRLIVSPGVFACCWWFIVVMHFFCAALAFAIATLYLFFSLPTVYPTVAVVGFSLPLMKASGATYTAFSFVHCAALLRLVRWSVRSKRLTLTRPRSRSSSLSLSTLHPRSCMSACNASFERFQIWFWKPWNRLFGVDGLFGVNGRYFYAAFLVREVTEVGLQTYQAYQLSSAVRRAWVVDLAVAVIALNSVSTLLVYVLLRRHQESAKRFVSILLDMSLDFCSAAVIPICVVYPYVSAYDISIGSMPTTLTFNDSWFVSSMIELRQFCVTSVIDFFATMLPQVTVFTCLNLAKKIIRRLPVKSGGSLKKKISIAIVTEAQVKMASSSNVHNFRAVTHPTVSHRLATVFHVGMVAWGIGVVVVHNRANLYTKSSTAQGCRLSLNAWYATGTPCSVMQINCHRHNFQGSAQDIATILQPLDRSVLRKLIITHCPALEVPPLMGQFSSMTDFDVYNSTLVSWPSEAAATPSTMRSLVNFNWFRSPYVGFPSGLLHNNLPERFSRLSIAHSNMTELPPSLGKLWSGNEFDLISLQFTQITHLPPTFSELNARKVRLLSNRIQSIDDRALARMRLISLQLSGNPLESWPASVGDTSGLLELLAEYTNVSRVSDEVMKWWDRRSNSFMSHRSFSVFGSPFCADRKYEEFCARDHGNRNGTIPWDVLELQRGLEK